MAVTTLSASTAWGAPRTPSPSAQRILDAARRCIQRVGAADTSLSGIADEAGLNRRTVYRHFENLEEIFSAVGLLAAQDFQHRLDEATRGLEHPVDLVVESLAFAIEEVPRDPLLHVLVASGRVQTYGQIVFSPAVMDYCRQAVVEGKVDWAKWGYDDEALDDLVMVMQRMLQSFLVIPDTTVTSAELRAFLRRWLGPSLIARGTQPQD